MNTLKVQLKRHPTILKTDEIKELCKPLEWLNITTFSHLRVDVDGSLAVLCNQPEFMLNYIHKEYYDADPCVQVNKVPTDIGEYIMWDTISCQGRAALMMQDAASFGFKHVFTVIKSQKNYNDFYHFGTHVSDSAINQNYINNLDLLDHFINYFNNKIKQSRDLSSAYDIALNENQEHDTSSSRVKFEGFSHNLREKRINFIRDLNAKGLNNKEVECIPLLIEGKTAKEIAYILRKSVRTIEDRITSLKDKYNAKNKSDLIVKIMLTSSIP